MYCTKQRQYLTTLVNRVSHALLHANQGYTSQRFVLVGQSVHKKNPYITSMTVLVRSNPVMFNNVDSTNVVTNSNDEELTIPPGYYTIGQIIAILNTMTDTTFSISTKASSNGCIYIQSTHHQFHQCSG